MLAYLATLCLGAAATSDPRTLGPRTSFRWRRSAEKGPSLKGRPHPHRPGRVSLHSVPVHPLMPMRHPVARVAHERPKRKRRGKYASNRTPIEASQHDTVKREHTPVVVLQTTTLQSQLLEAIFEPSGDHARHDT